MGAFSTAYDRLNDAQRQAVDSIEGPLMVVAGPGTGKTQVIALRVANILKKTQMRPGNVLCLTFSVSGATAMRERLRSLIGSDAYGVTVKNFHGFCNDLIAEHPLVFDDWSALEQISDVERYRAVNGIIDEMMPDLQLVSKKMPYMRTSDILSRISTLKREGVTDRSRLLEVADEYEQTMSSKSKEGTKAHEKNVMAARKFRDFLGIFFRYQEMLSKTQRYDYEDMILYVLDALKKEDWLLQGLQERYQYVLVDEFQDTNGAQYGLVDTLTSYPTVDHEPNVCIVGDDDQAIYRFQGANLTNILAFRKRFPDAPVVALTTSYRCTQSILDAASSLISQNTERLVGRIDDLNKDLVSGSNREQTSEPFMLLSPSDTTEPWMVAEQVQKRLDQGVAPEEIAILVQKNAELELYFDVLTAKGIPVQMSGKVDLLSHPYVQQSLAVLRYIEGSKENSTLANALGCACFGCHPVDLARLYAYVREGKASLYDVLLSIGTTDEPEVAFTDRDAVVHARNVLLDLSHKTGSRTLVETLEHVLKDTGLLEYARGEHDRFNPLDFAALQEFFERIKYRAYEQPELALRSLLADFEYYENPDYRELRLSYDLPHLTETGVQLMTAYQSKGLEFDTVFLVNFRHGHWDNKHSPAGVSIPEDLLFGWEKDQKKYEKQQDERRVAYVAMTRARNELIFTCPKRLTTGDKSRDVSPSAFFAEAGELSETLVELDEPESVSTLLFDTDIIHGESFNAFLRERLETFALSVTALNHFLEDPQKFIELDLLRVPQAKESSLVYGNAVHEALKKWGLAVMSGDEPTQAAFMTTFKKYLEERELLTESEKSRLIALGEQDLPRYFEQRLHGFIPHVFRVEHAIGTHVGDVPIKGKIDRIDTESSESAKATVVDYKTGAPKSPSQIIEDGYLRQLVFYALLLENGMSILKPESFVLDFVGQGTDHPVERAFIVSQEQKKELTETIEAVWAKILALDFTAL